MVAKEETLASRPVTPSGKPEGVVCHEYSLPQELGPGKTAAVTATGVYSHVLTPKPAEISPLDPQRVLFEGELFLLSPYVVAKQTTEVGGEGVSGVC